MLNVHLRITDASTGRPTAARVRVVGPNGAHHPPLGRAPDFPGGRNEDVGGHLRVGRERWWYVDGACELPLPAGVPLTVQIAKGFEYAPLSETVTLGAGQISLRFSLARWADARADGWVSVDTRCHFLTPHAALLEAHAEGLDVVNLLAVPFPVLAHDAETYTTTPNLLAFSGQAPALEADGRQVVVNTLNAHPVLGKVALLNAHRPIYPLTFGGEDTDDWGVCDWADQCHRKGGLVVWVDAFEPAAGVCGGEALVAAVLGKIDAIEVIGGPRKVPLLPWVYRLWDAGIRIPLVGASGKDSNKVLLGGVRTYVRVGPTPQPPPCREGGQNLGAPQTSAAREGSEAPSLQGGGWGVGPWPAAIRSGHCFATAGPFVTLTPDGNRLRAAARAAGRPSPVEIVANGSVVASGEGEIEASLAPGWVAARCPAQSGFAHTSPVASGEVVRKPEAVAALVKLIGQVREWAETAGRYANPKRKQALLDRCAEALARLEGGA
jgi:hypothetical protein